MRDADLLAVSLTDLDRGGYKLNDYLSTNKDLPDSVVVSLFAADRIRLAPRPLPSDEFRIRSRRQFVSLVQHQANERSVTRLQIVSRGIRRILIGGAVGPFAAVLLSAAGAGAWGASATALPTSALYPAKVATEWVQLAAAVTPAEKAEIRLSIATSRLVEANTELRDGNAPLAAALLGQFDAEFSDARAIVAAQPQPAPGNPFVAQLDRRLAVLQTERDQVAAGGSAGALVAMASAHSAPGAVATSDPAKFGGVASSVDSNITKNRAASEDTAVTNTLDAPATVVASASTTQSAPSARPDAVSPLDQSMRLCRLLVAQVKAGDANGAFATAGAYAAVVHELSTSEDSVAVTLRQERGAIVAAAPTAPAETRGAVQLALSSLDDVLGVVGSSSSRSVAPVAVPVTSTVPTNGPAPATNQSPVAPGPAPASPIPGSGTKIPGQFPSLPGPLIPVLSAFSPRSIDLSPAKLPRQHPPIFEKPIVKWPVVSGLPTVLPATARRAIPKITVGPVVGSTIAVIARGPARAAPSERITKVEKIRTSRTTLVAFGVQSTRACLPTYSPTCPITRPKATRASR